MSEYLQPVEEVTGFEEWTYRYTDPQGKHWHSAPMARGHAEMIIRNNSTGTRSDTLVHRTVTITPWEDAE